MLGINVTQQACGVEAVLLYSSQNYEEVDVTSANWIMLLPIIIQVVKTLLILIPIFHLDVDGQQNLLFISLGGMSLLLAVLGMFLVNINNNMKSSWAVTTCIPLFVFYIASYAFNISLLQL